MTDHDFTEAVKNIGDTISVSVVLASLTQILPPIAALFTILWTGIRIYEWARVRLFGLDPIKTLDLNTKKETR